MIFPCAERACSVVTCSFSCLARSEQPTDGCVGTKKKRKCHRLFMNLSKLAGPELAHVSLSDPFSFFARLLVLLSLWQYCVCKYWTLCPGSSEWILVSADLSHTCNKLLLQQQFLCQHTHNLVWSVCSLVKTLSYYFIICPLISVTSLKDDGIKFVFQLEMHRQELCVPFLISGFCKLLPVSIWILL